MSSSNNCGGNSLSDQSPIQVTAIVSDDAGDAYFEIAFLDLDGCRRTELIIRGTSVNEIAKFLLKRGANVPDDPKEVKKLVEDALAEKSDHRYAITHRCGHHGDSIVDWERTYGPQAQSLIFDRRLLNGEPSEKGSFERWKCELGPICRVSSYLTFAIAIAFAAPLLDVIDEQESCLFHFHGQRAAGHDERKLRSSSGKSTAIRAMLSVQERAEVKDLKPFAITPRALAELCAKQNDRAIGIDEAARAGENAEQRKGKLTELTYAVSSGVGKVISEKVAKERNLPNLTWRAIVLSTGEHPLDLTEGKIRDEGEQLRLMGIPVPPGGAGGIFDRLDNLDEALDMIDALKACIKANYGVARPHLLAQVVGKRKGLKRRLTRQIDNFFSSVDVSKDPWERRFARRFAVVSASAVIAAKLGVAPWTAGHARRSVKRLYRRARAATVSKPTIVQDFIDRLRSEIKKGRFPLVEHGARLPKTLRAAAIGIERTSRKHGPVLAIPRDQFANLLPKGPLARIMMGELVTQGIVVKSSDGKRTHQMVVKGLGNSRKRFVCIRKDAIGAETRSARQPATHS